MNDVDVLIVGAGAAGLAAARTLLMAGRTVMVLEARDRIGGRVWTEPDFFGHPIDHGASFIHVWPDNPWTAIARRLGFETVVDQRRRFLLVDGKEASPSVFNQFMTARQTALDQVEATLHQSQDCSIADAIALKGPFAPQARASLGPWLLGEDNRRASAQDFANGVSGTDHLVPGGYGRLVSAYGQGLPVRRNSVVTDICVSGGHGSKSKASGSRVELHVNDGVLHAQHALVTVPIGVLAAERIRFEPALEPLHLQAIDDLPMGLLQKIVLAFDGDPFGLGDGFYLHEKTRSDDIPLYFCRPAGSDHVIAFVGGDLARRLEAEGEAAARDFALAPLEHLFGQQVRTRFLAARQTRWAADPFALGSYSVAKPKAAGRRLAFDQPHAERIHFAGEAAASDGWAATVAGAFKSGRRAAHRILDALSSRSSTHRDQGRR